ncbi:MAG: ATP-binding protein [Acidobacteriota bacterium]|nr:ATP-binding protein [Acidobacteriota bacterium]
MDSSTEVEQATAAATPVLPTPPEQIVQALRSIQPFEGMSDEEFLWLARNGIEQKAPPGALLFHEGDPPTGMNIMLRGEVHIRRAQSGNLSFFIARMGQISGVLPFSRMKGYGGTGFAAGEVWTLDIPKHKFPDMLAAIPSMAQRCVSVLLNRVREVTRMEMQAEKLTALGKLAANLAHELNNPASAAQRSAASLFSEIREFGDKKQQLGVVLSEEGQYAAYQQWARLTREKMAGFRSRAILPDNPLDLSDREDIFRRWLEAHHVEEPWTIAADLAESPITIAHLDELANAISPKALAVSAAAFSSSLRVERMAETVLDSTVRIFDLISAIKDYSYMDQAPIQEIDLPQSLDTTLTMFTSRLEHVTVHRQYQPGLPQISAYGSELNQVWTELIENALDAMSQNTPDGAAAGTLRLHAASLGSDMVSVEVWNTGPEIPPDIVSRIFEPFYTTKPPGQGLGLGLDTVTRIVSKHNGAVTVRSDHTGTCFQVRLPIERAQAY